MYDEPHYAPAQESQAVQQPSPQGQDMEAGQHVETKGARDGLRDRAAVTTYEVQVKRRPDGTIWEPPR